MAMVALVEVDIRIKVGELVLNLKLYAQSRANLAGRAHGESSRSLSAVAPELGKPFRTCGT